MSRNHLETLDQIMRYGHRLGLGSLYTEDSQLNGRTLSLNRREMINFGSCSYLGLEHHPAIREGIVDAARTFGSQFSSSRTYASIGLYQDLEAELRGIFERPVMVSASTTLGHLAALPVLIHEDDAVILDMQVHSSVQMSAQLLKAQGAALSIVRHNDMDALESKIASLKPTHRRIWYLADGVYSMYGDFAPLPRLQELLERHPQLHLYIDDAHGMSWTGENGRGYVRSQIEHHERMVLAVSLNKAFAAAGGAVVFPNDEMKRLTQSCGTTMLFSGPIQPPMLGAAIASARIHRSPELPKLQERLAGLVRHTNARMHEWGIPQFMTTDSPLFFVPVGLPKTALELTQKLHQDGLFLNPAAFPATPMKRGGLRFCVNAHLRTSDVDRLLERIAYHYEEVLEAAGSSPKQVARQFRLPRFEIGRQQQLRRSPRVGSGSEPSPIRVRCVRSIDEIEPARWDALFADRGNFNHSALRMLERVFARGEEPENHWDFFYFFAEDPHGEIILATFYTCALVKDDVFAPAEISRRIEERRRLEPGYMTSKSILLGSMITKGDPLFLDRRSPWWREALRQLVAFMEEARARHDANQLMLREFLGKCDRELDDLLLELGLTVYALPATHMIEEMSWTDRESYLRALSGRARGDLRREVLRFADAFEVVTHKPRTPAEIRQCWELYGNVYERNLDLNVFRLPYELFEQMCRHEDYDVIRLYLRDDDRPSLVDRRPVAVMFSFRAMDSYFALIVGLDYEYLRSHNVYKQILYRTVRRARDLGCSALDLAYTAELVKKKVGASPVPTRAYVQTADHFNMAQLAVM